MDYSLRKKGFCSQKIKMAKILWDIPLKEDGCKTEKKMISGDLVVGILLAYPRHSLKQRGGTQRAFWNVFGDLAPKMTGLVLVWFFYIQ